MLPATQSITSVNEVRAIDFVYSSPSVVGSASGRSESTDQTICCTSFMKAAEPARGERMTNATLRRDRLLLPFEAILKNRPIHGGGRRIVDAIVMHVPGDANNLAPIVGGAHADLLAEGGGRICHKLSGEILRDDRDGPLLVSFRPGQVAAGNQRRSHRCQIARRDEFETANRRKLARLVDVVLREDRIVLAESLQGNAGCRS